MANARWITCAGLTPAKTAVVLGLTLVLVVVCVLQFNGGDTIVTKRPRTSHGRRPLIHGKTRSIHSKKSPSTPPNVSRPNAPWPELKIDEIVQYDPFQLPRCVAMRIRTEAEKKKREAERSRARAARQTQVVAEQAKLLAELKQAGVRLIVSSGGRRVALVGKQPVQVGDDFHGLTVAEIRADGIVLTGKKVP